MTTPADHSDLAPAYAALGQGRPEAALLVRGPLVLEPRSFEAWHLLGLIRLQQSDPRGAVGALARAAVLSASTYYIAHNLGLALLRSGMDAQAFACFRRSFELTPENVMALGQMAQLLLNGSIDDTGLWSAGRCLRVAFAIEPTYAEGYRLAAHMARLDGLPAKAERALRRAMVLIPGDPAPARDLVDIMKLQGKAQDAFALLREIDAGRGGTQDPLTTWLRVVASGRLELETLGDVAVTFDGRSLGFRRAGERPRARLFVSYLRDALPLPADDPWFDGHSNRWEAAEITRLLLEMGFDLDVAGADDAPPSQAGYAGYLASVGAPWRTAQGIPSAKLRLATGSSPDYGSRRERERADALTARTGASYRLYRQFTGIEDELVALAEADAIALGGNAHTLSTYPAALRSKFRFVPVSASPPARQKGPGQYLPAERHFLWYFGTGALLKGLDLVLEAFARQDRLIIEVVGPAVTEPDLRRVYGALLTAHPRIIVHGSLPPRSPAFTAVLDRCFAFVAPSASEGISTAAITCLQAGLYPIVSRDCGLDLPSGCGRILPDPTVEDVSREIAVVAAMPDAEIVRQIAAAQRWALDRFSRNRFSQAMATFLRDGFGHLAPPSRQG